jgi:hypothetical protein
VRCSESEKGSRLHFLQVWFEGSRVPDYGTSCSTLCESFLHGSQKCNSPQEDCSLLLGDTLCRRRTFTLLDASERLIEYLGGYKFNSTAAQALL